MQLFGIKVYFELQKIGMETQSKITIMYLPKRGTKKSQAGCDDAPLTWQLLCPGWKPTQWASRVPVQPWADALLMKQMSTERQLRNHLSFLQPIKAYGTIHVYVILILSIS